MSKELDRAMSTQKISITTVQLAAIDEGEVVPTILYYDQGRPYIGKEAREKCTSPELLIEDFKIEWAVPTRTVWLGDQVRRLMGNVVGKIFADWVFGVFESVTPKRFSTGRFQGNFRNLRGASQTFIHLLEYEGRRLSPIRTSLSLTRRRASPLIYPPFTSGD